MSITADKVAVKLTAMIASEEEWFALLSAETVGQAQKTCWVQNLRIDPEAVLAAATEIRANRDAVQLARRLICDECPHPPCFFSMTAVMVEVVRLYYELRAPRPAAVR